MVFMINVLSLLPQEPTVYIQIQSMAPKKKGSKRDAKKSSKSLIKSGKEQVVKKKGKGKGVKSNVKEQIVKRKGKKELSLRETLFSSLVSDKDDGKALKESKGKEQVLKSKGKKELSLRETLFSSLLFDKHDGKVEFQRRMHEKCKIDDRVRKPSLVLGPFRSFATRK